MENSDIIKIFLFNTIPDLLGYEFNMPYVKFVFDYSTLDKFTSIIDENKNSENFELGIKSLRYLYDISVKYQEKENISDDIYIKVDDPDTFFSLLSSLIKTYDLRYKKTLEYSSNFIRSIWLRMGVDDINNVNNFLKRQLAFLKNDDSINYSYTNFSKINDLDLLFYNDCNDECFETNNNMNFLIRNDEYKFYTFPSIHYGLSNENGKIICYIYGIQNVFDENKDPDIKKIIQGVRKKLSNKYVSPDFLLSLSFFLDFLYLNGIYNIEVPLLQVYNYPYHEYLSNNLNEVFSGYTEDEKKEYEALYEAGDRSDKILDYIHNKKMYGKFAFKEDIISKNKTERLVNSFMVLEDKLGNIELLNEPFMQGDSLKIKIDRTSSLFSELEYSNTK